MTGRFGGLFSKGWLQLAIDRGDMVAGNPGLGGISTSSATPILEAISNLDGLSQPPAPIWTPAFIIPLQIVFRIIGCPQDPMEFFSAKPISVDHWHVVGLGAPNQGV
jgi:hypothetical protein